MTAIEWTDVTWNPVTGCTKVSPGCDNCYAERITKRFGGDFSKITLHHDRLKQPHKGRKPRRVFVNSMSDLFHKEVPDEFLEDVFSAMTVPLMMGRHHIYQILTKRAPRMKRYVNRKWPWIHQAIWLGVSVESRKQIGRIKHLQETGHDKSVRFISFEPLIGPIGEVDLTGISWVIVGGESGPRARMMEPDWAREILAECRKQKVAFFMKQMGAAYMKKEWLAGLNSGISHGGDMKYIPQDLCFREDPVDWDYYA